MWLTVHSQFTPPFFSIMVIWPVVTEGCRRSANKGQYTRDTETDRACREIQTGGGREGETRVRAVTPGARLLRSSAWRGRSSQAEPRGRARFLVIDARSMLAQSARLIAAPPSLLRRRRGWRLVQRRQGAALGCNGETREHAAGQRERRERRAEARGSRAVGSVGCT